MITSKSSNSVSGFLHFYTFLALLCFALCGPPRGTWLDLDTQTSRIGRFLFSRKNRESNQKRNEARPLQRSAPEVSRSACLRRLELRIILPTCDSFRKLKIVISKVSLTAGDSVRLGPAFFIGLSTRK